MADLARMFSSGKSSVGRGKDSMAKKILKNQAKENLKLMKYWNPLEYAKRTFGGIRKPKVYKKKSVINPEVLAKISEIDVEVVEKALKKFLDKNLKNVILDIGENGKTVTLGSVLKVLKNCEPINID